MSKSLIERLRDHLACYWKEGDVAPQLTSIELILIEEAANELAAAQAEIAMLKNEYICKCGLRVEPHRCKTGEEF